MKEKILKIECEETNVKGLYILNKIFEYHACWYKPTHSFI